MDAQNKTIECAVNVSINDEIRNIKIRHKEQIMDARIRVDEESVEVKAQKMPSGVALHFEQDGAKVIVTIIKDGSNYIYDCFVNQVSVKDGMPWKIGKYDLPEVLKWRTMIEKGMKKYIISEAVRGAIVGFVIFLILVFFKLILPNFLESMNLLIYFFVSVLTLSIFYALLSPGEFKAGNESVKEYNSYRGEKSVEVESEPHKETNVGEELNKDIVVDEDDSLPDILDIIE